MTLEELLPELRNLSRPDKLRAMRVLLDEISSDEGLTLSSNVEYPVWTPHNAFEAADTLLKVLRTSEENA